MQKQQKKRGKKEKKRKRRRRNGDAAQARPGRRATQVAARPQPARDPCFYFWVFFFFFFFSDEHIFSVVVVFFCCCRCGFVCFLFQLQIKSQRLDFHVDVTWKKCHIRHEQSIKIEFQILDLYTLNRVSQTQNANKKYNLKISTTMQLRFYGHLTILTARSGRSIIQ